MSIKTFLSFDAALHNLGVCYIQYNSNWLDEFTKQVEILKTTIISPDTGLHQILAELKNIDTILNSICVIKWANIFDLTPGFKVKETDAVFRTSRLKSVLNHIDAQIQNKPDYVLVEYQMVQNTISLQITNQIMYHYSDDTSDVKFSTVKKHKTKPSYITGAIDNMKPSAHTVIDNPTQVVVVKPGAKNSINFTKLGSYGNFIAKKSSYKANKAHSVYNFLYYTRLYNIPLQTFNKLDDLADAFMQCYVYIMKERG
jgi:hypothetical protein